MCSVTHLSFYYAEELINTLLVAQTEVSPFCHLFSVVLGALHSHLHHLEPECQSYLCDMGLSIHCSSFKLNSFLPQSSAVLLQNLVLQNTYCSQTVTQYPLEREREIERDPHTRTYTHARAHTHNHFSYFSPKTPFRYI